CSCEGPVLKASAPSVIQLTIGPMSSVRSATCISLELTPYHERFSHTQAGARALASSPPIRADAKQCSAAPPPPTGCTHGHRRCAASAALAPERPAPPRCRGRSPPHRPALDCFRRAWPTAPGARVARRLHPSTVG